MGQQCNKDCGEKARFLEWQLQIAKCQFEIGNLQFPKSKNAAPERRFCQGGTHCPCLELKQGIAGDGQLVPPVVELAEAVMAGEVTADFGANLQPFDRMIIEAERDFLIVGVGRAETTRIE